jgi:hypothetical protein
VGPRAGLDDVETRKYLTLPRLKPRPLGCPAHIQSLYRLRYPGYYRQCNSIMEVGTSMLLQVAVKTVVATGSGDTDHAELQRT